MTNNTASPAPTTDQEVTMNVLTADDFTPEAYEARRQARLARRRDAGMSPQARSAAIRRNPNATAEQLRSTGWRGPRDL